MTAVRTAEIVAVGSELLTPFRIDTNSLFLTAELNAIGIDVIGKQVAGDSREALAMAVRSALGRADVVVTSGGLGPTADDLTREAVADALGVTLVEDAGLVEVIRQRFTQRGAEMPAINRRQAMVIPGADVLPNPRGSAPGLYVTAGARVLVLLPGPPRELEPMMIDHVRPRLAARAAGRLIRRRVLKVAAVPESAVDERAAPVYAPWRSADPPIETTILASPGQVELHVSARGTDVARLDRALDGAVEALARVVGDAVFSTDGRAIERVVGEALAARGATIAVAESCTGGLVAGRLTDVAGSSAYVLGGVVAYANDAKNQLLDVPREVIATHGAVSEPVASAMAEGVRRRFGADLGVAVTGIAGPGGGTAEKPVGTVCFAVAGPGQAMHVETRRVPGDRGVIRQWSVMVALDLVRRALASAR